MNINEFLNVLKVELPESHDLINGETKFRDLEEWDSLTGMSIVVLLEETYNVPIPENIFKSFSTFQDIYNYIVEKK